jgi:reactive chlorine resistance protein C
MMMQASITRPAMNVAMREAAMPSAMLGQRLETVGGAILRYGMVAILLYFGAFKFTAFEAAAIQPLLANSPLMAWLYSVTSLQGASNLIGVSEIVAAVLIAARPWSARLSALGSILATGIFLATLSFLVTRPEVWASVPGFPLHVPGALGGFLLKDVFLLGAAVWTAGEALRGRTGP